MSLPSFLVIGAQKAGTTWLWGTLRQHPAIWMPPLKELHFFDHLFVPNVRTWTYWHICIGANNAIRKHIEKGIQTDYASIRYLCDLAANDVFTEDWYRRAFTPAPQHAVLGDITPEYSTIGDQGIAYLKAMMPWVRIIYLIRDPVGRALSQVRMAFDRSRVTSPGLAQWTNQINVWDVSHRGDYKTYIPQWRAAFSDDQLLFLPYRRLATEPAAVLAEIERFVGVSPFSSYNNLTSRDHATKPLPTPPEIDRELRTRFAAQYVFLREAFPSQFIEMI